MPIFRSGLNFNTEADFTCREGHYAFPVVNFFNSEAGFTDKGSGGGIIRDMPLFQWAMSNGQ